MSRLFDRWWTIPLLLGGVTLLFFSHVLLPPAGEALPGSDFQQIHYPLLKFIVAETRATGTVPLWNPHQFLGYSVVGNPQNGLFYPPNWLLLAFDGAGIERGVDLLVVLHAFWAAWGMTLLARQWGADRGPALLAGVLVGSGGFLAGRIYAGHYAMILAFAWLPWVLAGAALAAEKGRLPWALPGGIALAFCILAGHPQTALIVGLGLLILWAVEMARRPDAAARWRLTRQWIAIGITGLVLSAASWLPMLDYAPKTSRGAEAASPAFANEHALPAHQLVTLIIPNLFGTPQRTPPGYWPTAPFYEETVAYLGLLPLLAVLLVIALRPRGAPAIAALIVVGLLLSLGFDGVLWLAAYRWLPPLRTFRAPGRALMLVTVGLAGALALALTVLSRMDAAQRRAWLHPVLRRALLPGLILLGGGALLASAISAGLDEAAAARVDEVARQLALAGVFWGLAGAVLWAWTRADAGLTVRHVLALTAAVAVIDAWHLAWPLTDTAPVDLSAVWREAAVDVPTGAAAGYGRVMQLLQPTGIPNGASWTGHLTTQGYDPIAPAGWSLLMRDAGWDPGSPLNRLMGMRYALSASELSAYQFPSEADFKLIGIRPPFFFYENQHPLARAYLARRYEVESDPDAQQRRLAAGEASQGDLVLLAADPGCEVSGGGGQAAITAYRPNHVTVQVAADGPGLLVLSDQYDDDWQVTVDGRPAKLRAGNIAFRVVCVPGGTHTVRFTYRPWALYAGGAITLAGWGLLGLGGLIVWLSRRRAA